MSLASSSHGPIADVALSSDAEWQVTHGGDSANISDSDPANAPHIIEVKQKDLSALEAIGRKAPVALHTISSQIASATSTCALYPLDLLRTRFMSQDGTLQSRHNGLYYSSIPHSLRVIVREEGARALFRGCGVAVLGSAAAWGLYMFLYRELCNWSELTSYAGRSGVSMVASMTSSLMMSPVFMMKSRMQLEEGRQRTLYSTFRRGVVHTVRTGGVRSLWRGGSLQLLLVFPNSLGLPTYDFLKTQLLKSRWGGQVTRDLTIPEVCLCSAVTKFLILVLSHPLVVAKVRMQDQRHTTSRPHYRRVLQSFVWIVKTQGIEGLYRGFSTALLYSFPRSLLHYIVYEKTLNFLCHHRRRYITVNGN